MRICLAYFGATRITAAMAEGIRDGFADRGCEVDEWDATELGARNVHPDLKD